MVYTSNKLWLSAVGKMIFKARRITSVEMDGANESLSRLIIATQDDKSLIEVGMIKISMCLMRKDTL